MPPPQAPTAIVVGAGIGGLAAALALRQAGFAVEAIEREAALRSDGAGLSLWPNALNALDFLGLGGAVRAAGRPQEAGAVRNARGAVLSFIDPGALAERFGEGMTMIERPVLHRLLADAVGEGAISLGVEAIGAQAAPAPTVMLAGGGRRSADLIVAADGVGSVLRTAVFDRLAPESSGLVAWRGVLEVDERLDRRLIPGECWARGALFGMTRLAGGRIYWWMAERCPDPAEPSADAEHAALVRRAAPWPDPAEALVARTPPAQIVRTPLLERRPLRSLASGAVVLLGDAAHPMLPHLGQGGCQALEDAAVLGACLRAAGGDVPRALGRYERERLRRTAAVVRRSARMSRIAHLRGPLAAARNLALRAMPAAATLRQLDDVVGWRLEIPPRRPGATVQ